VSGTFYQGELHQLVIPSDANETPKRGVMPAWSLSTRQFNIVYNLLISLIFYKSRMGLDGEFTALQTPYLDLNEPLRDRKGKKETGKEGKVREVKFGQITEICVNLAVSLTVE